MIETGGPRPGAPAAAAPPWPKSDATAPARGLVVSTVFSEAETARGLGREAYSYRYLYRAFAPLLRRWGETVEVTRPARTVDDALRRARRRGLEPLHLSFLPVSWTHLASEAPTITFPAWEFPDIPNATSTEDPRYGWVRLSNQMAGIVTYSTFARQAFVRSGVRTPVYSVPVPIDPAYFVVPDWAPGQRVILDGPVYVFPEPAPRPAAASRPAPVPPRPTARSWARQAWAQVEWAAAARKGARLAYKHAVRPYLPRHLDRSLTLAKRTLVIARELASEEIPLPEPLRGGLELSGVVYTSILNPIDGRKNWKDVLSAYLLALRDREDATLVLKLVVPSETASEWLGRVLRYYCWLKVPHRCKLVLVTAYLSEAQMVELARASTYYLNASRAEGACIPLQAHLAAGRPAIAPTHTAMADYVDEDVGFPVASHPEPSFWPERFPGQSLATTWHRIVWQSLHDQIRASYELARDDPGRYAALAARGRERLAAFAGREAVWPRLAAALDATLAAEARTPASS